MTDKTRWGILGTGLIAKGLAVLPGAELTAIGSRSQATADTCSAVSSALSV